MTNPRVSRPSLPGLGDRETLPGRGPGPLPPLAREAPPPAAPAVGLRLGFSLGAQRMRRRSSALSIALGAALVVVAGVIERRVGSAGAVDRALTATFNLVIPLCTFGLVAEATGRGALREGVWPVARYGAARRDVALGAIAAALVASAVLATAFAVLSVAVAHADGNLPFARDALTSAWIGALVASAYAGWFALGATFGRRGGGRWAPLLADFVIGGSTGLAGAILPRGNAHNLLGGAAPLALPQSSSTVILAGSAVILVVAAALRCRE